jgi:hypothetical protein
MKKWFSVSLCRGGLLGGTVVFEPEAIYYRTGKLTVPPRFRNLEMRYADVVSIEEGKPFPTVTLTMKNGESFTFLVFSRRRFVTLLKEKTAKGV